MELKLDFFLKTIVFGACAIAFLIPFYRIFFRKIKFIRIIENCIYDWYNDRNIPKNQKAEQNENGIQKFVTALIVIVFVYSFGIFTQAASVTIIRNFDRGKYQKISFPSLPEFIQNGQRAPIVADLLFDFSSRPYTKCNEIPFSYNGKVLHANERYRNLSRGINSSIFDTAENTTSIEYLRQQLLSDCEDLNNPDFIKAADHFYFFARNTVFQKGKPQYPELEEYSYIVDYLKILFLGSGMLAVLTGIIILCKVPKILINYVMIKKHLKKALKRERPSKNNKRENRRLVTELLSAILFFCVTCLSCVLFYWVYSEQKKFFYTMVFYDFSILERWQALGYK